MYKQPMNFVLWEINESLYHKWFISSRSLNTQDAIIVAFDARTMLIQVDLKVKLRLYFRVLCTFDNDDKILTVFVSNFPIPNIVLSISNASMPRYVNIFFRLEFSCVYFSTCLQTYFYNLSPLFTTQIQNLIYILGHSTGLANGIKLLQKDYGEWK